MDWVIVFVNIKLPLTLRLLLFNVLVLFLPIATLLYLDTYEKQLLSLQEHAMVQQGRLLSAALQDKPLEEGVSILANLEQRSSARIRILDHEGRLIADTAREDNGTVRDYSNTASLNKDRDLTVRIQDSFLYQLYSMIYRVYRKYFTVPLDEMASGNFYSGKDILLGEEVQAALNGRYGAVTRVSSGNQISVNLYSALPVYQNNQVAGVVLVSQSTFRILGDLYKLRLDIIRIFSLSLLLSLVISLLLSLQITRPIVRLSRHAEKVLDPHGQFTGHFPVFTRKDELGDLSRSLQTLSLRLEQKIHFIDSMTADLVHELKNPISSLSSSMELLEQDHQAPYLSSMTAQIMRMDELLNRLRELTSIEQLIEQEERETLNLREYLPLFIGLHLPWAKQALQLEYKSDKDFLIQLRGERLTQILLNLLENALSFSPEGEKVILRLDPEKRTFEVLDRGPGVPQGNIDKLFQRFFTDRRERANHSGLGLSIVWAIVTAYGGTVEYRDRPGGGACFCVQWP